MKAVIIGFCCLLLSTQVFAFTPATKADVQKYDDECGAEKAVPADRLTQFKAGEFTEDQLSKCHIACVAAKMGIFDTTSGPILGDLVTHLTALNPSVTDIQAQATKCTEHKFDEYCEWAYTGFACLQVAGLKVSPDMV